MSTELDPRLRYNYTHPPDRSEHVVKKTRAHGGDQFTMEVFDVEDVESQLAVEIRRELPCGFPWNGVALMKGGPLGVGPFDDPGLFARFFDSSGPIRSLAFGDAES